MSQESQGMGPERPLFVFGGVEGFLYIYDFLKNLIRLKQNSRNYKT